MVVPLGPLVARTERNKSCAHTVPYPVHLPYMLQSQVVEVLILADGLCKVARQALATEFVDGLQVEGGRENDAAVASTAHFDNQRRQQRHDYLDVLLPHLGGHYALRASEQRLLQAQTGPVQAQELRHPTLVVQ
eukprot:2577910-Pleurochrysis_carterae.AAC.2